MITVLRTASGASVAPSVIACLRNDCRVRVVAADACPLSSGFYVADRGITVPRVQDPSYLDALLAICQSEKVDVFWPDLDEELLLVARNRQRFEEIGTRVLISPPEAIETCVDKHDTAIAISKEGLPAAETYIQVEDALRNFSFPILVKPRKGRGSRDVFLCANEEELAGIQEKVDHPIYQEYLPGREYTIDTLSDAEGVFRYGSIRERITTDSGISVKGRTVRDDQLMEMVSRICNAVRLVGPACLQCKQARDGSFKFIEINPRIAGTAILSVHAGAPIIEDAINVALGRPLKGPVAYRYGCVMIRYWSEIFVDSDA